MLTRILLLFIILCILISPSFSKNKKVLILNSYHEGYHWTDRIMSGIKSVLSDESDVELYIDYMDTKRKSDQYYYIQLKDLYAHKYSLVDFDLVLSSDDNALNFLLNYRDELFPGIPIVFCGINKFEPSRIEGYHSITGVYESYDVIETIKLMLKLHPDTRKIYAICDNTYSGNDFRNLVIEAEDLFTNYIDFIYLTNMEMDLLKNRLQNLKEDALVLWTVYLRTPQGISISSEESVRFTSQNSLVPVYCIWDVVGQGVVGGNITSPNFQGEQAAKMALRILEGEKIEDIPVSGSPMVNLFDYNQLLRFNIDQNLLPANSIILNKPYSLYSEYKSYFWLVISFIIILITVIIVLFYYIKKGKQVENALALSHKKLVHAGKMDTLGQLAGGVAHDFNNMLSGIMSAAQLLKSPKMNLDDKGNKYVDLILQTSKRAASLTSKLLSFSRKENINLTSVDIHQIIEEIVSILQNSIDKKITIKIEKKSQNHITFGDNTELQNAILNLCINASNAMPYGGEMEITTKNIRLSRLYCNTSTFALKPGEYCEIEIKDTGCGIPPGNINKIFEPFFTTKDLGKGTGLGLSAVYKTVQDHHGEITVYSEVDSGSSFHIKLPCNYTVLDAKKDNQSISFGSGTILLVDDEELIRITGKEILKEIGYKVLLAKDGQEAIKIFEKRQSKIDLIIIDMIMPVLNGREAFEKIKNINNECKVILSSGFTKDENIEDLIQKGLAGFIRKPYSISELSKLIKDVLEK